MDNSNEQPPAPDSFGQSTAIPIGQISPEFDRLAESSIRATVTLVWPYSSSTKAFSFLLAEPDFRLRRSNGQVKVVFHEIAAEKVAKTQVGIGDEVVLSLAGSRLEKNEAAAQTPGRYVAWDVHLDDRVHLEISRSSQHYSTVKIDPPLEPVQHAEVEPEPPVTPIVTRTRPKETDSTAGLSSWASPAFFQRSRASLGTIVDTRLDPFAEEDGFVPGKGRKRPRFSMRSSEWRVVDEPASPGEKATPVDWTEELENESLEPEVDGEGTTEDIDTPQEVPKFEAPLPETEGISSDTTVEDTTVPANQLVPETSFGIERPVEPDATKSDEAARQVNEKAELAKDLYRPINTPRLLPIPPPGLSVPSPFVSAPDTQQDHFASVAASTQTRTTTGLSQTTTIENLVSEVRPGDLQTETAAVPAPERIDEDISTAVSESVTETDVLQKPAPTLTAATTEPMPADNIKLEEQEEQVDEDDVSASLDREAAVEEEAHIKDDTSDSLGDIKMEGNEGDVDVERISIDEDDEDDLVENEDEEEDSEQEASDEEDEQEAIKSEEEEEEEGGKCANQVIDVQDDLVQAVERDAGRMAKTADIKEGPDEAVADESDSAQSPAEPYSEPEEGYYVRDEDKVHQDEEIYDEEDSEGVDEYESEHRYEDGEEEVVDSELESDEESDEQPYQTQAPLKSAQPEVIVLDSDDENEQHDSKAQMQMPIQPKREGSGVSDDQESYEVNPEEQEAEGWASGEEEEVEDEVMVMADGRSDEGQDYSGDEYEDDYDQDEEQQAENDERVENERVENEQPEDRHEMVEQTDRIEDEQVEDGPASDDQEQGSLEEEEDDGHEEDEEDVNVATSTKHATTTHLDTDKELPVDTHVEETHAPEELARHSEQDIHEHDTSTAQDVPSGPAVDRALYQFETSAEDTVSNEKQETVDQLSEVLIEHAPKETEPNQGADPGLLYDGAVSPRVIHESLLLPPDSLVDQRTVTLDSSQETGPIQQVSEEHIISETPVTPEQTEEWHEALQLQAELSTKSDDALDLFGTPEEEPRFRSLSIPQQERVEINERVTHQNSQAQAVLGEGESQLQDGHRGRDRFSEKSELYVEALAAPDRQYPGLRSKLSYFAPLATLIDHFHTLVDTISIVHDSSSIYQAASGKKDYTLTLHLTDPSLAGTTLTAQLFRPYKEALPSVSDGDAILLRNFTVKSFNHSMILVSVDTSAWAVFSDHKPDNEAEITGPPVEYGDEEHTHATDLRQWYQEDGAAMVADNQLQASLQMASESREITPIESVATSDSGLDSIGRDGHRDLSRSLRRSRKSHRRITIHELRDGRRYTEVGSPSDRESIHELRDGTVYANL